MPCSHSHFQNRSAVLRKVLKAKDASKALKKKGFSEDKKRDHFYYFFCHDGKKSNIYTKISHNETDLGLPLCSVMARQIKLSVSDFKEFVDCKLSAEKYLEILTSNNLLG